MESPKYKAINFDLDTRKMRQYGKYPIGYTEVKRIYLELDKKDIMQKPSLAQGRFFG